MNWNNIFCKLSKGKPYMNSSGSEKLGEFVTDGNQLFIVRYQKQDIYMNFWSNYSLPPHCGQTSLSNEIDIKIVGLINMDMNYRDWLSVYGFPNNSYGLPNWMTNKIMNYFLVFRNKHQYIDKIIYH